MRPCVAVVGPASQDAESTLVRSWFPLMHLAAMPQRMTIDYCKVMLSGLLVGIDNSLTHDPFASHILLSKSCEE